MISIRHETSTPTLSLSDSSLSHIHDRLSVIDSRLLELRSTVLTKDGYVDRRNREDEHIRREFEANRSISNRIDLNVVALRTDVDQLKSGILQLKSSLGQAGNETVFLRSDVDRLSKNVEQIQADVEHIQTDVCGCRVEISKLHSTISQLRTDLITLQHETSRHLNSVFERFSMIESRMKHSERVRFNSLAITTHAPITPVPVVEVDGTLRWPEYFPRTVWRFWCLKKRSRRKSTVETSKSPTLLTRSR
jgi:chromosome segregation ATPase